MIFFSQSSGINVQRMEITSALGTRSVLRHGAIDDLLGPQSCVAHLYKRVLLVERSCEFIIIRCIDRAVMVDDAFFLRAFHKRLQTLLRRLTVPAPSPPPPTPPPPIQPSPEPPAYTHTTPPPFSPTPSHNLHPLP